MNDRYLFRGLRVDGEGWITGSLFVDEHGNPTISDGSQPWEDVDPATAGQCTGLKDKHGKLIFEGDVVKGSCNNSRTWMKGSGEIKWSKRACRFFAGGAAMASRTFEIIGNIHEEN